MQQDEMEKIAFTFSMFWDYKSISCKQIAELLQHTLLFTNS